MSCIPDSKAKNSGFYSKTLLDSESHKGKSHRFRNLNPLTKAKLLVFFDSPYTLLLGLLVLQKTSGIFILGSEAGSLFEFSSRSYIIVFIVLTVSIETEALCNHVVSVISASKKSDNSEGSKCKIQYESVRKQGKCIVL